MIASKVIDPSFIALVGITIESALGLPAELERIDGLHLRCGINVRIAQDLLELLANSQPVVTLQLLRLSAFITPSLGSYNLGSQTCFQVLNHSAGVTGLLFRAPRTDTHIHVRFPLVYVTTACAATCHSRCCGSAGNPPTVPSPPVANSFEING